jgi:hyperosmotically inducible protein
MNEQSSSSRKTIVAIAMAVIIGVGAVTFALRSHRSTPIALIPIAPTAVPQTSDAASSPAQADSLGSTAGDTEVPASNDIKPAPIEPKSAGDRHVAKARSGDGTSKLTSTGAGTAVDSSPTLPDATVASSMGDGKNVDLPATPSAAPTGMAANAPEVAMSAEPAVSSSEAIASSPAPLSSNIAPAASDIQITTAVKSEIAADGSSEDASVGVITTNGVVALTGSLATQEAINHLKGIAEKVQDVKSVDVSALKIT